MGSVIPIEDGPVARFRKLRINPDISKIIDITSVVMI